MSLIFGETLVGSSKAINKGLMSSQSFPSIHIGEEAKKEEQDSVRQFHSSRGSLKSQSPNWITTFSYGVGHFLNDMTAACWFNYLLVFLTEVAEIGKTEAGIVMLAGQITDALWTPVVGLLSDQIPAPRFGRRKTWVLAGAVLVNVSFFFVFSPCWLCKILPVNRYTTTAMYAIFASIFNVGWATLQVSHMSLAPELTEDESERVKLYSARNAGAIVATLLVLGIATLAFQFCGVTHKSFLVLAISAIGFGNFFTLIFLLGVKEIPPDQLPRHSGLESKPNLNLQDSTNLQKKSFKWYHWFKLPMFWQIGIVYMLSRVTVNIFQVFTPFFLNYSLNLLDRNPAAIAEVPATIMVVSFVWTMALKWLNKFLGRRSAYTFGAFVTAASLVGVYYLSAEHWYLIFGLAIPLGVGTTTVLVTGISMEADVVGRRTHVGAFVYGAMSFLDKAANGILIVFLTRYSKQPEKIRDIIFLTPSGAAAIATLISWTVVYYWRQPEKKEDRPTPSSQEYDSTPLLFTQVDYDQE